MHTTQHRACFALLRIRWWRRQRVGYETASLNPIHEESVHSKILPRSAVNSTPIWIQVVRIVCNSEIVPLRRSNPRRPADKGYLQRKPDLKPSSALLDAPTPHLLSHIGCWRARPRLALRDLSHSLRGLRPTATSSRQRTRRGVVLLVVPWLVGAGREARAEAQHARHTDWQRQTCDSRQPTRGAHHHNSSLTLLEHPSASLLSDG